jgi:hypothetical protein
MVSHLNFDLNNKTMSLDFKLHKSANYRVDKVSTIYDIDKNIPIDLTITKTTNERELYENNLNF